MKVVFINFFKGLMTIPVDATDPSSTKGLWEQLFSHPPTPRLNTKITLVRNKDGTFRYKFLKGNLETLTFAVLACPTPSCEPDKVKMVKANSNAKLYSVYKSARKLFLLKAGAFAAVATVAVGVGVATVKTIQDGATKDPLTEAKKTVKGAEAIVIKVKSETVKIENEIAEEEQKVTENEFKIKEAKSTLDALPLKEKDKIEKQIGIWTQIAEAAAKKVAAK